MLRDLAPQRGKGSAQWDVIDTVAQLGPCTWDAIRVDTGRRNVPTVVRSLLRRGRLVAYDERTVDLPCEWAGYLRVGVRDPVHFSTRHRGWVRELSAWFEAREVREDGRLCAEGPLWSSASWIDVRPARVERCEGNLVDGAVRERAT